MVLEQETRFNKSLNAKPQRLDKQEEDSIRKALDEVIAEHRDEAEERQASFQRQQTYMMRKNNSKSTAISWKKKLAVDSSQESTLDLSEENFIWNTDNASEFLSSEKMQELTNKMNLIKYTVYGELEYKYLQFNLLIDCLDELIVDA